MAVGLECKWLTVTKLTSRVTKLGNVLRIGQLLQACCYFLEDEAFNVAVGLGCKWLKVTKLTSRVTRLGNVLSIGQLWEAQCDF